MRHFKILPLILVFAACNADDSKPSVKPENPQEISAIVPETISVPEDIRNSVVRINSTQQSWNIWQPWEKTPPRRRRALAAIVGPGLVLTTAEMVADATYLEFESADGTRLTPAKVLAADYEANLALLGPAAEPNGRDVFKNAVPFEISSPPVIGDQLAILQVEDNGNPLLTAGSLQSVDVSSSLLAEHSFLTFMVKASMQSAASSYSLPVLKDGKLAGVLISYDSKDQLCDVLATDIVARFVQEAADGKYTGFPSLGVTIARAEDVTFRKWLKLADDQGGLYIKKVRKGGAAAAAGVLPGDVLLAVDGQAIDRRGYYNHPKYGSLSWGHLVRGEKSTGDTITLSLLREGKPLELKATLTREEESAKLVPAHNFGKVPNYLVKGGLVFQELSLPLLEAFGEDWQSRAPLNLLDAMENPESYEKSIDRVVLLSGVIPTPATIGYERLRHLIVRQVNGKPVRNMKALIEAFDSNSGEIHSIEFSDENLTINLDELTASEVDSQLLQRGITRLSRVE